MKSEALHDSGADLAMVIRRHPWLVISTSLVAVCAITFVWLDWRAEKRWQRYAADARARDVKLVLADFALPEIPDAENFAALPMFHAPLTNGKKTIPFTLPEVPSDRTGPGHNIYETPTTHPSPKLGNPFLGTKTDWVEWQTYFRDAKFLTAPSDNPPADVVRALEHFAPEFQQWNEWRTRPRARPYEAVGDVAIEFTIGTQFAARVFALRMQAHLALGDLAAARADFENGLQGYRALKDHPVVEGMTRLAILSVLIPRLGEGFQGHHWSDADCQAIQEMLASIRVCDDWRLMLSSTRGEFNTLFDAWAGASIPERKQLIIDRIYYHSPPSDPAVYTLSMIPLGMIRDNQLRENQYVDELLARIDSTAQTIDLRRKTPSSIENITNPQETYRYMLIRLCGAAYSGMERRHIAVKTLVDEAQLACALERFRYAHGSYPETLTELVPAFIAQLPIDIDAGAGYRYQRVGNTSFRLYGVGPNGQDDGGQPAIGVPEQKQLDAIWIYAPPVDTP